MSNTTYNTVNYVQSSEPGKHWNIYAYKPDGRPAYVAAYEGKLSSGRTMLLFSFDPLTARKHTMELEGRNTAQNRATAIRALFTMMQEKGLIAEGESCPELV